MASKNFFTPKKLGGRMEVQLFGDWDKAIRTVQTLSPKIKAASIKAQTKVAKEIQKKVKAHLRNQDLGWRPLNPTYAVKKSQVGADSRTLMAWGNYYDAIEVWTKGNRHLVYVGVKKGVYTKNLNGKRSKRDIATIAVMHEFSSGRRLPRRPLWNPTIRELGGPKGLRKMYLNSLYYWLRIARVPVSKVGKVF